MTHRVMGELDAVLSNGEIFSNLKQVTIFLRNGPYPFWNPEHNATYLRRTFLKSVSESLPQLRARGMLDISSRQRFTDESIRRDEIGK